MRSAEVGEQPAERVGCDAVDVGGGRTYEFEPLLRLEQVLLARVGPDSHDDLVEDRPARLITST